MTTTPSDRVQVRPLGSLQHPGACALCGSGNCEDGYVDTSVYYEYEGTVYFCMRCAHQIANAIGCLLPDESAHLTELNAEIAKAHKSLERENAELRDELNSFRTVLALAVSRGDLSVPAGEVAEQGDLSGSDATGGSDDGESEPKESVKVSGPANSERATVRNRQLNI